MLVTPPPHTPVVDPVCRSRVGAAIKSGLVMTGWSQIYFDSELLPLSCRTQNTPPHTFPDTVVTYKTSDRCHALKLI